METEVHNSLPPVPILSHINVVHAPPYCLKIYFNSILPHMSRFSKWSPSFGFPHQNPVCSYSLLQSCHIVRPSHYSWFDHPKKKTLWEIQMTKLPTMQSSPPLPLPSLARMFSSVPHSKTPSDYVGPPVWSTNCHTYLKQEAELYFCTF